jgi:hypothetical protein
MQIQVHPTGGGGGGRGQDIDVLQAGYMHPTENCIYGLSTHSLAGVVEDVLPLVLQSSTAWQECFQATPGGHILSYQQAR